MTRWHIGKGIFRHGENNGNNRKTEGKGDHDAVTHVVTYPHFGIQPLFETAAKCRRLKPGTELKCHRSGKYQDREKNKEFAPAFYMFTPSAATYRLPDYK